MKWLSRLARWFASARLLCLVLLFFGSTKLLPAAVALGTLYFTLARPLSIAAP